MSGIINSAGSKSGVIGETELDYEEGTWTAKDNAGADLDNQSPALEYTKVGRIVTIRMDVTWTTESSSTLKGLPFTCSGGHHGSAFAYTDSTSATKIRSLLIGANSTTGNIYNLEDDVVDPDEKRYIGSFVYQSV